MRCTKARKGLSWHVRPCNELYSPGELRCYKLNCCANHTEDCGRQWKR
jgi:hypothetical protein